MVALAQVELKKDIQDLDMVMLLQNGVSVQGMTRKIGTEGKWEQPWQHQPP